MGIGDSVAFVDSSSVSLQQTGVFIVIGFDTSSSVEERTFSRLLLRLGLLVQQI
jgi:hypothetical protein